MEQGSRYLGIGMHGKRSERLTIESLVMAYYNSSHLDSTTDVLMPTRFTPES